jgi:predicted metal-dependent HD superfamily phosphohydrolase
MSADSSALSRDSRRETFVQLVSPPGDRDAADAIFDEVIARYSEPHRRYHTVEHVTAVVDRIPKIGHEVWPHLGAHALHDSLTDVLIAAWYHDVIYDPTHSDNEDRSAELAIQHLKTLGFDPARISNIVDLILMTKGHRSRTEHQAILADADLWTLGGPPEEYRLYGRMIRHEYAHVSEEDWIRGRSIAMRNFLDRPTIFATRYGRAQREVQAQVNVTADVEALWQT